MGELEIPERALIEAARAHNRMDPDRDRLTERVTATIQAAAPIIVAAELRRLAASFDSAVAQVPLTRSGDQLSMGRIIAYQEGRDIARRRADELDPPGDESQ